MRSLFVRVRVLVPHLFTHCVFLFTRRACVHSNTFVASCREKNAANAQKLADESARIAKLQSDCDELGGEQMEMLKNEAVEAEANKVLTVKARQKAEKSNVSAREPEAISMRAR